MRTPTAFRTPGAASRLLLLALAVAGASCASVSQLARRSERARLEGDYDEAYELALEARAKDPQAPLARSAVDEAVWALARRERTTILMLAASGDSLAAADRTLEMDRLRERFYRDGLDEPADSAFDADERRIRLFGAAWYYDLGTQSLEQHRPKEAWRRLVSAREMMPGYRDLDRQIASAWRQAETRVVVLPFNDQVGIAELPRLLADETWLQLARRVRPAEFTFTRLLPPADVWKELRIGELGRIDRDRALGIGRALGAQRVVYGRVWNLRTDTDTQRWSESIWRPESVTDTSGYTRVDWHEVPFHAVSRTLTVRLQAEYQVVDTDGGEVLERRDLPYGLTVHTAYCNQKIDGGPGDYRLCSPSVEKDDAHLREGRWSREFAPWSLERLLELAQTPGGRSFYRKDMLVEFVGPRAHDRVFLDDLPPPEALATALVLDVWEPLLASLRSLDDR